MEFLRILFVVMVLLESVQVNAMMYPYGGYYRRSLSPKSALDTLMKSFSGIGDGGRRVVNVGGCDETEGNEWIHEVAEYLSTYYIALDFEEACDSVELFECDQTVMGVVESTYSYLSALVGDFPGTYGENSLLSDICPCSCADDSERRVLGDRSVDGNRRVLNDQRARKD